jgi:hypothetical protein
MTEVHAQQRPRVHSLEEEFDALHAFIRPKPEELRWTAIPWETDLWAARRKAQEAGKPIFLWAMNGHPLGCV